MDNATAARLPSDRKFGVAVAIFLSFVGILAPLKHWGWMSCVVALIGSAIVAAITVTVPSKLAALNIHQQRPSAKKIPYTNGGNSKSNSKSSTAAVLGDPSSTSANMS